MKLLEINNSLNAIDENTIFIITKNPDNTFKLIFFRNCSPVFEKDYNSFFGAKIASSKLFRKYS